MAGARVNLKPSPFVFLPLHRCITVRYIILKFNRSQYSVAVNIAELSAVERYKVEISIIPSYDGVPVGRQMVSVYCDCKAKTHKVVVPPRNATPFDPLCFRQSTPHIAKDRHVKTSFALASMRLCSLCRRRQISSPIAPRFTCCGKS